MHRRGEFEPDERLDAVAFGEAVETTVAMLDDALDQVRGDAGVERAVPHARHDIGAGLEVGVHGVEASGDGPRIKANESRASFAGDESRLNRMLPRASSCRTSSDIHAALGIIEGYCTCHRNPPVRGLSYIADVGANKNYQPLNSSINMANWSVSDANSFAGLIGIFRKKS